MQKRGPPPSPETQVQKKAIIEQQNTEKSMITANPETSVTRSLFDDKNTPKPCNREEVKEMEMNKTHPQDEEEGELPRKTVNCIKRAMQELLDEKITPLEEKIN